MTDLNQLLHFDPDSPEPYIPPIERVDEAELLFSKDLTYREEVRARARSVIELMQHGLHVEGDHNTEVISTEIFTERTAFPQHRHKPDVILRLEALLTQYDHDVVQESVQIRRYVTNKLIDEAEHAQKASERIKALELLGKMGDVGLFVERSVVTVEHKTTAEIEEELQKTLTLLLNPETNTYEEKATIVESAASSEKPANLRDIQIGV